MMCACVCFVCVSLCVHAYACACACACACVLVCVRLWIDNALVIDQWSSLARLEPSAVFKFQMQDRKYDIHLEWARENSTNASSSVELVE